jgi:acyl carrier protein
VNSPAGTRVFDKDDISSTKRKLIERLLSSNVLREKLLSDSLDIVELVMELEECGIEIPEIPEEEWEKMKTIDEWIDFILYRLPED